jgi:hypothetical protein
MHTTIYRSTIILIVTLLTLSACTLLSPTPPPGKGADAIYTQAAQTVVVQLTQLAYGNTPTAGLESPTGPAVTATSTSSSATSPASTDTSLPPTATPVPGTATPIPPSPTVTPVPCDWAQFVTDVTVPDGTILTPKSVFTKIWRLKNVGDCTWGRDYDLVFVNGTDLKGPGVIGLPKTVKPGETVDLSIELIAPNQEGNYRGYWQLRNASNHLFGVGAGADNSFWVDIEVVKPGNYVYDFGLNYCVAEWYSDAGHLPCPGQDGSDNGFIIQLGHPILEGGRKENEIALWTRPENTKNGWIRGEFPEVKVSSGDHFKAVIGCLDGATKCDVTFQLNYRIGNSAIQTLWEKNEVYDGHYTKVDVDLNLLEGEKVEFLLTVLSNGSPKDDQAFWLAPRIVEEN